MPTPEGLTPEPEPTATPLPASEQVPIAPDTNAIDKDVRTDVKTLPPDIQDLLHRLNSREAADRIEIKKLKQQAQQAEEKRMADQAEWQKLAETRATKLDELAPVAEQFEELKTAFAAVIDSKLAQIPEDVRKAQVDPVRAVMTPVQFSKWLDAALPTLSARKAPDLEAGAGGRAGKKPLGTTDLKRVAY